MSVGTFEAISSGKAFPPISDANRQARVQRYRQYYDGNWNALGISAPNANNNGKRPVQFNWFRRLTSFYAEFMFGSPPVITSGNSRLDQFLQSRMENIADSYQRVLVDMLRYGMGVPIVNPGNGLIDVWQPDSWFAVHNGQALLGDVVAFVINRETGDISVGGDTAITASTAGDGGQVNKAVSVLYLPISGQSKWQTFEFAGGSIGNRVSDIDEQTFPDIGLRRASPVFNGYAYNEEGVSAYADIADNIAEIAKRITGLGEVLDNNQRPHLAGPASAVKTDANGNITIDAKGQFFPLQPGDSAPEYLTWDSDLEAVKSDINMNQDWFFAHTGLSRLIFFADSDARTSSQFAAQSGISIRRQMMPLFAKLSHLKRILSASMRQTVVVMAATEAANGGEVLSVNPDDIEIEWGFEEIFADADMDNQEVVEDGSQTERQT